MRKPFYILLAASFTLRANLSHSKAFVVARVRLGRLAAVHCSFICQFLNLDERVAWVGVRVGWIGLNS